MKITHQIKTKYDIFLSMNTKALLGWKSQKVHPYNTNAQKNTLVEEAQS